jgi:hypothetical protein
MYNPSLWPEPSPFIKFESRMKRYSQRVDGIITIDGVPLSLLNVSRKGGRTHE